MLCALALHAQADDTYPAAPWLTTLATELRAQLDHRAGPYTDHLHWPQLTRFYAARDYMPVWLSGDGNNARADTLLMTLSLAWSEGLEPGSYSLSQISSLWNSASPWARVKLELLLTNAFFDYSQELLAGQLDPQWHTLLWHIKVEPPDSVALLHSLLASDDFGLALKSLPPNHPGYQRLREALARYRQLEASGGWPTIPAGEKLRPGTRDPRLPLLRQRLQLEGELQFTPLQNKLLYEPGLRYAVERFQLRHGLKVDGVVGPLTLAQLNVPVARRIDQIRLNMERWRWLPEQLGQRHIIVNVSAYQLSTFDHGERVHTMDAIVGTCEDPTPQITGKLHTIVFNPYWNIPKRIALEEVIPKQIRDPDYFASRGIRVFSDWNGTQELAAPGIDWPRLHWGNFDYMLRQDPGPNNPLGKLKFLFTNNFRVYLHDTPAQQLFNRSARTFSHGCIRVEAPRRLAAYLLGNEPGSPWSEAVVRSVIATGLTREVEVSPPVPVYLLYLTAWVGDDGAVHFHRDVYGEDALLLIELQDGELD